MTLVLPSLRLFWTHHSDILHFRARFPVAVSFDDYRGAFLSEVRKFLHTRDVILLHESHARTAH